MRMDILEIVIKTVITTLDFSLVYFALKDADNKVKKPIILFILLNLMGVWI